MTRGRGDLRNDHLVDLGAARFDVFGFDTRPRQQIRDIFRIFRKIHKLAQPVDGKFHRTIFWITSPFKRERAG